MIEVANVVDQALDQAIVKAIDESPFKRLTVREISQQVKFSRGITEHIKGMRDDRKLVYYIGCAIDMDTEVIAC